METKLFDLYQFEVDDDAEEVTVEASDEGAPLDIWRGRFTYEEVERFLRRITNALERS